MSRGVLPRSRRPIGRPRTLLGRGVLSLLVAVTVVSALLLAAARLAGPALGPRSAGTVERAAPGEPADGGGVKESASLSDLSFYSTLGRSSGGPGASSSGTLVRGSILPGRPETTPGGAFVVQALATRDGATARRLRDRLAARGLPAVLVEAKTAEDVVYRVRVGRYRERGVAESVARRLRDEEHLSPWVLREES